MLFFLMPLIVTIKRAFGINNSPESHKSGCVVIPLLSSLFTHHCVSKRDSNPLTSSVVVTVLVGLMTMKQPTHRSYTSSSFIKTNDRLTSLYMGEAAVENMNFKFIRMHIIGSGPGFDGCFLLKFQDF